MGSARAKQLAAGRLTKVDLGAPVYLIGPQDRTSLAAYADGQSDLGRVSICVSRIITNLLVMAQFPQGMDRAEAPAWTAWQEAFHETIPADRPVGSTVVELTWGTVEWMRKIATRPDLKIGVPFIQWREALCEYLETIALGEPTES